MLLCLHQIDDPNQHCKGKTLILPSNSSPGMQSIHQKSKTMRSPDSRDSSFSDVCQTVDKWCVNSKLSDLLICPKSVYAPLLMCNRVTPPLKMFDKSILMSQERIFLYLQERIFLASCLLRRSRLLPLCAHRLPRRGHCRWGHLRPHLNQVILLNYSDWNMFVILSKHFYQVIISRQLC